MFHPVMNNTKWNELRLAMYELDPSPRWTTLCDNGYRSEPDREWYYHFRNRGYEDIIHVDILPDNPEHRERIRVAIREIHLPCQEIDEGFRVYGYSHTGQSVDYL